VDVVVDSSVLIAAERGLLDLDRVPAYRSLEVAIAAITASEMLHGVHRVKGAAQRARVNAAVDTLLGAVPIIPFDLDVARVHAMLSAELRTAGTPVGAHDLMIAATAVYFGAAVATRDLRSFPRISGLEVLTW
jgi:tRNA(fMet)-specific endonuclease VapC